MREVHHSKSAAVRRLDRVLAAIPEAPAAALLFTAQIMIMGGLIIAVASLAASFK